MADTAAARALFTEGYAKILEGLGQLGYDVAGDQNFAGTAARAAGGLTELALCADLVEREIAEMLSHTFPARYDEMVISKHNVSFGICPHHLLPVIYRISLAYIPKTKA